MTENGDTATTDGSMAPSIEQLPDGVREFAESEVDGELQRSSAYTCRNCGLVEYGIRHDDGVEYIVDNEVGDVRMHHLGDTSSTTFHLDGDDIDPMYLCDHCFDELRHRGIKVIGTMPNGDRTTYRTEDRIVAYPSWEFDMSPKRTPLDDALLAVIDDEIPHFEGEPMVDIREELSDKRREMIVNGDTGIYAIVYGSWGSVFVPEWQVDKALGRGRTIGVSDLPESLRVEENASHYTIHHTESESAAGFDCTDFGDPSTFRRVLEAVNLDPDTDHYRIDLRMNPDDEDALKAVGHVWVNDEVMIQTGNDPLSGEYDKPELNRDSQPGYASMIGIEGRSESVKSLFGKVKRNTEHFDDVDIDGRGFI